MSAVENVAFGLQATGVGRAEARARAAAWLGRAFVAIRPNAITLHREAPVGSARNAGPGRVGELYVTSDRVRARVDGPVSLIAEVTVAAVADLHLGEGGRSGPR